MVADREVSTKLNELACALVADKTAAFGGVKETNKEFSSSPSLPSIKKTSSSISNATDSTTEKGDLVSGTSIFSYDTPAMKRDKKSPKVEVNKEFIMSNSEQPKINFRVTAQRRKAPGSVNSDSDAESVSSSSESSAQSKLILNNSIADFMREELVESKDGEAVTFRRKEVLDSTSEYCTDGQAAIKNSGTRKPVTPNTAAFEEKPETIRITLSAQRKT